MTYKFKVEVSRHNPYQNWISAITSCFVIALLAAFVWMKETDAKTSSQRATSQAPVTIPPKTLPDAVQVISIPKVKSVSAPVIARKFFRRHTSIHIDQEPVTFVFSGQTTHGGAACAKAQVQVCVITNHGTETRLTETERDGSYSVKIPIQAGANDDVAWTIEAHAPDLAMTERSGRKIITDATLVSIPQSLAL